MRTNIELDNDLVVRAMQVLGASTQREAVESALQTAIRLRKQEGIRSLRGIGWDGDLEEMRLDKPRPPID